MNPSSGNKGVNHLAQVLTGQSKKDRDRNSALVLDFGEIMDDYGLQTNTFSIPIPVEDYHVCRQLTLGKTGDILAKTQAIGSPGSWGIPPAIVQILNAVLLFDMDLQQAINEPRAIFTSYSAPLKVYAEPRLPEETIQALIDAGYEVDSGKDWNTSLGRVGVVLVDPDDGFVYAGGDNRRQYKSLAY